MPKYVVAVQCQIVKERCSGYMCEQNFHNRRGAFAAYEGDADIRFLSLTCGGCCGKATQRKLRHMLKMAKQNDGIEPADIVVHLSSCASKSNYHSPACPHLDYLQSLIGETLGLQLVNGTVINDMSEKRRAEGVYPS